MSTRAQLRAEYERVHGALVKPNQGWSSLAPRLWLPYSMGRKRSFTDLGTYVDKPLDHGGTDEKRRPPAWAFDLGRWNRFFYRGWDYKPAQALALFYWENHVALDIEYIILGQRIISRKHPFWRERPKDSHQYHIHVSGHWPGRD